MDIRDSWFMGHLLTSWKVNLLIDWRWSWTCRRRRRLRPHILLNLIEGKCQGLIHVGLKAKVHQISFDRLRVDTFPGFHFVDFIGDQGLLFLFEFDAFLLHSLDLCHLITSREKPFSQWNNRPVKIILVPRLLTTLPVISIGCLLCVDQCFFSFGKGCVNSIALLQVLIHPWLFVSETINERLECLPNAGAEKKDALRFEYIGPLLFGTFEFLGEKRFLLVVFSFFIGSITFDGIYTSERHGEFLHQAKKRDDIYCCDHSAFECSAVVPWCVFVPIEVVVHVRNSPVPDALISPLIGCVRFSSIRFVSSSLFEKDRMKNEQRASRKRDLHCWWWSFAVCIVFLWFYHLQTEENSQWQGKQFETLLKHWTNISARLVSIWSAPKTTRDDSITSVFFWKIEISSELTAKTLHLAPIIMRSFDRQTYDHASFPWFLSGLNREIMLGTFILESRGSLLNDIANERLVSVENSNRRPRRRKKFVQNERAASGRCR